LKIPNIKSAGGVAEGVGPQFKPQYHQKKGGVMTSGVWDNKGRCVRQ
jgi:hypothetical protein